MDISQQIAESAHNSKGTYLYYNDGDAKNLRNSWSNQVKNYCKTNKLRCKEGGNYEFYYFMIIIPKNSMTREQKLAKIKTFGSRSELYKRDRSLHEWAQYAGVLDELLPPKTAKLTAERILKFAKRCRNKTELFSANPTWRAKAKSLGILDKLVFNNAESTVDYVIKNFDSLSKEQILRELLSSRPL